MIRIPAVTLIACAFAVASLGAEAQAPAQNVSYRCTGKDGKRYYGQTIPPQCAGLALELLNRQGIVIKRIDPQGDAEKRAQKEAEESKKRQEEAALREETRRTRALLATYTSETDIESARKRALEDNEKAVKEVETRVAAIKTRQAQLAGELEFYKGKNKPPPKLEQDVKNAEIDLQAQQSLLDAKKKDVNTINAKYDEDKRRYLELTGGGAKKK